MTNVSKAQLKVELLDVGHGDALLLHWIPEQGDPSTILVDGGPRAGGDRIRQSAQGIGASKIDLVVLSHCDADHVDGLLAYVQSQPRLPIEKYWGPCIPAFERHSWLFPPRIRRGLDQTRILQNALGPGCKISWPVEGATWVSPDEGLSIRVISPAGRLIERLLLGEDALSLFLEYPTPLGWLLTGSPEPQGGEDPFEDLRDAIASGEITPDRITGNLKSTASPGSLHDAVQEAAGKGVEPEFFGNSVLNDTSIVLLVEARIGRVRRRLLFTGDLENFTYLMARWPMGLGCDIVKAPHHGSYSFVDRAPAYDAVWQWLRPRAALVSANGKHNLPRTDFRDAALRYGATLFCTSRRSREIVSGPVQSQCCHTLYGCKQRKQEAVSLSVSETSIYAEGVACARGNLSGVMPVIEVRQHVVEPSPILSTLADGEIRKHVEWVMKWLRRTMQDRRERPANADLEPISIDTLQKAAVAEGRISASVEMETILERAAREGKVWLSRKDRFRSTDRKAWAMPTKNDLDDLKAWIDGYYVVQLAVKDANSASGMEELLYAADTQWLAKRMAENLRFPHAMFDEAIWPSLVVHLLRTRAVGERSLVDHSRSVYSRAMINANDATKVIVLVKEGSIENGAVGLARKLSSIGSMEGLKQYLQDSVNGLDALRAPPLTWPDKLMGLVSPLSLAEAVLPPSGLMRYNKHETPEYIGVEGKEKELIESLITSRAFEYGHRTITPELVLRMFSVLIFAGLKPVSLPANLKRK